MEGWVEGRKVGGMSEWVSCGWSYFNPFTPRSDQYINSLDSFNTLSSRQVIRINKIII